MLVVSEKPQYLLLADEDLISLTMPEIPTRSRRTRMTIIARPTYSLVYPMMGERQVAEDVVYVKSGRKDMLQRTWIL
jgi:hypothetical protein